MTNTVDTELFRVVEKDDQRLITPRADMSNDNMGWTQDNVWMRSRIETIGGKTVSQGYGKFWNLECGPEFAKVTVKDVLDNIRDGRKIVATLKLDGSLLIRSVYKDKLILRTRGSFGYEHHEATAAEMEIFKQRYPRLFDTNLYNERTHLFFEWVTPNNQIVIRYDQPEIHLIGGVHENHGGVKRYLTMSELQAVSYDLGIKLVEYFEINSIKDWYNFYQTTIDSRDIEGYVLRLNDEQKLVKVKAKLYIAKHALKAELSFKKMVAMWIEMGCNKSHEAILAQLQNMYDEETVMWALPYVDALYKAVDAWRAAFKVCHDYVAERKEWSRKDFALDMQKRFADDRLWFSVAMVLYDDGDINQSVVRTFMERFADPTEERKE
jgi:T4 RnlA family RNA ligase